MEKVLKPWSWRTCPKDKETEAKGKKSVLSRFPPFRCQQGRRAIRVDEKQQPVRLEGTNEKVVSWEPRDFSINIPSRYLSEHRAGGQ